MAEDDVMVLVHGYLVSGFVGKDGCITKPEHAKSLQMRAAGKAFEQMLAGADASIASMASLELYNAIQTGVLQGANTSSSRFVSLRIFEQVKCYTPASDVALWFMCQPLLMNKATFDELNPAQQAALKASGRAAESFYLQQGKDADAIFEQNSVEIANMTEEGFNAWRDLAKDTSYKNFLEGNPEGQKLIDLALEVE